MDFFSGHLEKFCLVVEQRQNKCQATSIFAVFTSCALLPTLCTLRQSAIQVDNMYLLYKIFICVFALATIGQGAPKGKDTSKSEDNPEQRFRPTPEYLCAHVYKGFYSRYYLIGTEWPVHENLIFNGVQQTPGCHMTNWRFQEYTNQATNGVNFNCTVSLLRNEFPPGEQNTDHACCVVGHASPVPEEGAEEFEQLPRIQGCEEWRHFLPGDYRDGRAQEALQGYWWAAPVM